MQQFISSAKNLAARIRKDRAELRMINRDGERRVLEFTGDTAILEGILTLESLKTESGNLQALQGDLVAWDEKNFAHIVASHAL